MGQEEGETKKPSENLTQGKKIHPHQLDQGKYTFPHMVLDFYEFFIEKDESLKTGWLFIFNVHQCGLLDSYFIPCILILYYYYFF